MKGGESRLSAVGITCAQARPAIPLGHDHTRGYHLARRLGRGHRIAGGRHDAGHRHEPDREWRAAWLAAAVAGRAGLGHPRLAAGAAFGGTVVTLRFGITLASAMPPRRWRVAGVT